MTAPDTTAAAMMGNSLRGENAHSPAACETDSNPRNAQGMSAIMPNTSASGASPGAKPGSKLVALTGFAATTITRQTIVPTSNTSASTVLMAFATFLRTHDKPPNRNKTAIVTRISPKYTS